MIRGLPNLSVRATNALERAGFRTREQVEGRLSVLFVATGIGPKTRREILRRLGLAENLSHAEAAAKDAARRVFPAGKAVRP